jgi:hypothetical protein
MTGIALSILTDIPQMTFVSCIRATSGFGSEGGCDEQQKPDDQQGNQQEIRVLGDLLLQRGEGASRQPTGRFTHCLSAQS